VTGRALAILGCGAIANRHAGAARRLGIPLVFGSRDARRAEAYARRWGAIASHGSYERAVGDPRVAGVIVCTPHDRHLEDVKLALQAGRHVLVEKPIARTLEEADSMIRAAADAGRVLMVGENFRFMPAFRHVRALIDAGVLGDLRELHLIARGFRQPGGWRVQREAMGGGALIDAGIHYVHNLAWWGGAVHRVFALRPPPTIADLGGEDAIDVLAELDGGAVGFLSNSLGTPGVPRLQWSTVTGTLGACVADNRGRFVLVRGRRGGLRVRLFRRDLRGHERMLRHFEEAMERGQAREADGASGRSDLAVVLAVYRSIAERVPVELRC
jgi:predicted dehydrogenase